jgi:hypothetical protein
MYRAILLALAIIFDSVDIGMAQPVWAPCTDWCAAFLPSNGGQVIVMNKDWKSLNDATSFVQGPQTPLILNPLTDHHLLLVVFQGHTYWKHLRNDELCALPWAIGDIMPLLNGITCNDQAKGAKK